MSLTYVHFTGQEPGCHLTLFELSHAVFAHRLPFLSASWFPNAFNEKTCKPKETAVKTLKDM